MDPISVLEKRIEALELKVVPSEQLRVKNDTQTIINLLLETKTMITSALSCREAVTSMLQHLETINNYLNPTTEIDDIEIEAKRRYLLELYPEIKNTIQTISTFENLLPFIDSINISKVVEYAEKLDEKAVSNLKLYQECKDVTNKVLVALQNYNEISYSIKILFSQLDTSVSNLEQALQPKAILDE